MRVGSQLTPLLQALATQDVVALDACFALQDVSVIDSTVAELTPTEAVALLVVLAERLRQQPQRAVSATPWLARVLITHGLALTSAPSGQAALCHVGDLVRERTDTVAALTRLSGRLDYICNEPQPSAGQRS